MRPVAVTLAFAVLVSVLTLSACGSETRVQARSAPRLPRDVATSLAAQSDALAVALRRGDGCSARIQMHGLERQTRLAIASGRVPAAYRMRLRTAVSGLAGRIPRCTPPPAPPQHPPAPPPPPPAPTKEKHHGKGHKGDDNGQGDQGNGKKKGKQKHGKGEGD